MFTDKLTDSELAELEETKYFKEIYQNGLRLVLFQNILNSHDFLEIHSYILENQQVVIFAI